MTPSDELSNILPVTVAAHAPCHVTCASGVPQINA